MNEVMKFIERSFRIKNYLYLPKVIQKSNLDNP